ncbi:MAG: bifunctional (p)ppGpp synthetase/guanosine-3',5'-bis(diphosphate) 3'-pyrophosphohydrolase [Gammaproteobacteria bacterium]|nr:bifunctional (p)ppGpp synthetase/guanosine-3',5'-bis(diphosphate) 3'-pyrophosphohydrolase [Gammaproteobacteria bacterium]
MKHSFSSEGYALDDPLRMHKVLCEGCTDSEGRLLSDALAVYYSHVDEPTFYPDSLSVALQLKAMRADVPTLVAALLGGDVAQRQLEPERLRSHFGPAIEKLIKEVHWLNELSMQDISTMGTLGSRDQAELIRRMLLAIVEDIRAVLIKLAFRTQRLYKLVGENDPSATGVAEETLSIYTPLANRLGLGQLKWELEDLAFRILDGQTYKRIAKALEESRTEREQYIANFVSALDAKLKEESVHSAYVFGRPKHLYSIWKKMRAKRLDVTDLHDVRAVRVLVDSLRDCYSVLGIVHSTWQPITREFDDYIANPKPNGYQSLHTAVVGLEGKVVEVQIRTRQMDDDAENGVAAHWAYKEGGKADESIQKRITSLRQLLEDDDDDQLVEGFTQQLDAQRVYVFTPKGQVVDLSIGSTPLDFAYHVHSQIGHRCRGAKVNGSIVALTYQLRNGDQVEILTSKEPAPSRDWLNKSSGYLVSSRARAKVRSWFNAQDHEQHVADGRLVLERELKRFRATGISVERLAKRLKFDKTVDFFAAIGKNDITNAQIAGALEHLDQPKDLIKLTPSKSPTANGSGAINVRGVGNLLTSMAVCCNPVPYDQILGFITKTRGVSIHRADCKNILNLREHERERLIDVEWGEDIRSDYQVSVRLEAFDRTGLLRDVSTTLANQNTSVSAITTHTDKDTQTVEMHITLEVGSIGDLAGIMEKLRQQRNVRFVERVT